MSTIQLPQGLAGALTMLGHSLGPLKDKCLVGGSCGLLLQGVAIQTEPRDLDIYTDRMNTTSIHARLQSFAMDQVTHSETEIYRSWLSHYSINQMKVELVGGFCVETEGSHYEVSIKDLLPFAEECRFGSIDLRLMPLAHELLFNILRKREDRYEAIASTIKNNPIQHEAALRFVMKHHQLSPKHQQLIYALLPFLDDPEGTANARD